MVNLQNLNINPEIKGRSRTIKTWPTDAQLLHTPCEEVVDFDKDLHQLIADMFVTLENAKDGVALSANQIGVSKRVFVTALPYSIEKDTISPTATPEYDTQYDYFVFINPIIVLKFKEYSYEYEEGCLSVPGYYEKKSRPGRVLLDYRDALGRNCAIEFQGFNAFVVQHEIDHLDGKLFIDSSSRLKRDRIKKKIKKFLRLSSQPD